MKEGKDAKVNLQKICKEKLVDYLQQGDYKTVIGRILQNGGGK